MRAPGKGGTVRCLPHIEYSTFATLVGSSGNLPSCLLVMALPQIDTDRHMGYMELSSLDPGLGARAQDERRAASIARGSRRTRTEKRSGCKVQGQAELVISSVSSTGR